MNFALTHEPPIARSLLFVAGSTPDRFAKAIAAPADLICLDLEDAVAPDAKAKARAAVIGFVAAAAKRDRLCVRINQLGSPEGFEDAAALMQVATHLSYLMLPKAEHARDLELLHGAFREGSRPQLIALIENPLGVEAAFEIARSPAVSLLMFGSFDYSAETGCSQDWSVLMPVRSRIVAAAASSAKLALDSPYSMLDDLPGAAAEARLARSLGFCGKAAIHPKFVGGINEAFTATEAELSEARAILSAFNSASGGVARLGAKLIERPVVRRMQNLLDQARKNRRGSSGRTPDP